jgi:hypothetical protein
MTDAFRPDDEIVSAVLDGEATPEERARVEADPVLAARLAELTAVRDAVAAPVTPPAADLRERAIAAAMAERRSKPEPFGNVRPLRSRSADVPRFLAVAAAILVVLVGVGILARSGGRDDAGSSDDAALSAPDESSAPEAAGGESEEAAADAAPDLESVQGADLGAVATEQELADRLTTRSSDSAGDFDGGSATTGAPTALPQADVGTGTRGATEACQVGLVEADDQLSGLLAQARVDYAGQPAVVYVYGTPEGRQRVVAVTEAGCRTLAAFDL